MTENMLANAVKSIARAEELTLDQLGGAFDEILSGEAAPEHVGAFLMGLAVRGETGRELVAGAKVLQSRARHVSLDGDLLDTCGTGGLPWTSLNTSTASAIVIAACGGRVAKHGNRSVPPKTGSADVLEALGVELDLTDDRIASCMQQAGVAFLYARTHHSAMRHVAPIRQSLGIRTIFNLLGPLSNPAQASHRLLGVYQERWLQPMAEALRDLGVKRAWVVHGLDAETGGIDELSISGETKIIEVSSGKLTEHVVHPADAGLSPAPVSALQGGIVEDNARAVRDLLEGRPGPFRTAVLLNAAAGLLLLGKADDLKTGAELAAQAIDSGDALATLSRLADASHGRTS